MEDRSAILNRDASERGPYRGELGERRRGKGELAERQHEFRPGFLN